MNALPQTQAQTVPDAWDSKGHPADRSKTGGWASSAMILGSEVCERLTTMGIAVNLVTYLTGTMHLGSAASSNIVTNFLGTSYMLSLFGGFVADTFLGRYLTIAIFGTIEAIGVILFAITIKIPNLHPPTCSQNSPNSCEPANNLQLTVLYTALYVIALGIGGIKSSVSGFGSDQFDESNEGEKKQMVKFFSWFFFFISMGSILAVTVLVYIQDHLGRVWGYGLCACAIIVALLVFLSGTKRYRYKKLMGSPLTQIAAVFMGAWRKRKLELPSDSYLLYNVKDIKDPQDARNKKLMLPHTKQFRFLDKAAIKDPNTDGNMVRKWELSSLTDIEEVKLVIRMLPIWATTIMFWTIHAQMVTFSVSQATTLKRHIGKSFQIPPASLTTFLIGSILVTIPIYDRIILPIRRKLFNKSQGLTPLQSIGLGLVLSTCGMVAAALIDLKRTRMAHLHDLTHNTSTLVIPMSVFWLVPQFFIVGSGEAFIYVGQLDFFLRECPEGMKTMSTGLFLSTLSLGFFISSLLVFLVQKVTGHHHPWLTDDINQGKLYNFYWLLAFLSAINLVIYLFCAKQYVYKDKRLDEQVIELEKDLDNVDHA
ncbi:unnamed protein product [Lathyrus sativus]|nr:unnamed protein product [Lathyrus sativus]